MQTIPVASVECLTEYILPDLAMMQEDRKQALAT